MLLRLEKLLEAVLASVNIMQVRITRRRMAGEKDAAVFAAVGVGAV